MLSDKSGENSQLFSLLSGITPEENPLMKDKMQNEG